ncbi:hypothetical protein Y032_0010g1183 [Ancylostoma ceylanicum]|uniref:Uncharacterized protein n=1 Tax=Ancylostoma ceylanicum TaxID=53326 RepID=A0A016VI99_9BILA|nr:hypothetical protein Y032_0010g1183 [Ancylostoma ceylanicum]
MDFQENGEESQHQTLVRVPVCERESGFSRNRLRGRICSGREVSPTYFCPHPRQVIMYAVPLHSHIFLSSQYLQCGVSHFSSYCRDGVRRSLRSGGGLNTSRIGSEDLLTTLLTSLAVRSFTKGSTIGIPSGGENW